MAPYYIKPAVSGVVSGAIIATGTILSDKQQKGLAAGYIALDKAYTKYKSVNRKINGDDVDDKIYEQMLFDCEGNDTKRLLRATRNENEFIQTFHDTFSETTFESTLESVLIGLLEANRILGSQGYLSLNDLYSVMDAPLVPYGYDIGWSIDMFLEDYGLSPFIDLSTVGCNTEELGKHVAFSYVIDPSPSFMSGYTE